MPPQPPVVQPPVVQPLAIPAFPSVTLHNAGGRYVWIIGGDYTRGWDGMRWISL